MNKAVLVDDFELLDLMMADMLLQKPIYRAGPYWEHKTKAATRAIKRFGIKDFRRHTSVAISESYSDVLCIDPAVRWRTSVGFRRLLSVLADSNLIRRRIVDQFVNKIKQNHEELRLYRDFYINQNFKDWLVEITSKYQLPESTVGGCEDLVNIEGSSFSSYYLECVSRIYNYSSRIDFSAVDSILEIGGGFGANAHLLMHMFPNIKKYLYLDIPPNLYVGTQYLKYFFPKAVVDYKVTAGLERIEFKNNDDREILAIAPWQIEKVKVTLDGVWNSHSFVEMPLTTIQNYKKYIKQFIRKRPSSFLCMLTYDGFDLSSTIHPHKLVEVFESFLNIEEIQPCINLQEIKKRKPFYYFGKPI